MFITMSVDQLFVPNSHLLISSLIIRTGISSRPILFDCSGIIVSRICRKARTLTIISRNLNINLIVFWARSRTEFRIRYRTIILVNSRILVEKSIIRMSGLVRRKIVSRFWKVVRNQYRVKTNRWFIRICCNLRTVITQTINRSVEIVDFRKTYLTFKKSSTILTTSNSNSSNNRIYCVWTRRWWIESKNLGRSMINRRMNMLLIRTNRSTINKRMIAR